MENPATESWGLSISDADFAKLKRGVRPQDMDDKWLIQAMTDKELSDEEATSGVPKNEVVVERELTNEELMEADDLDYLLEDCTTKHTATLDLDQIPGDNISIRRSWSSNMELYRLVVKPSEGATSARIEIITWDQDEPARISEEQAKTNVVLLCRQVLGCSLAAAPDYGPSVFAF